MDIQSIENTVSLIDKNEKLKRSVLNWEELTEQTKINDSEFLVWSKNDTIYKVSLASLSPRGTIKFIIYCHEGNPIKIVEMEHFNSADIVSQDSSKLEVTFKEEIFITGFREYYPGEIEYEYEVLTEGSRMITDMYCQVNELLHPLEVAYKGLKK
ncbi:hypothetical protein SAMN06265375_1134 [Muriicola jejuensis]|uniref:Uncharacterized protein n=2 Tax=Muriicola jejuensis TaxID=504488 RepID=A0A6P0UIX8_9FLAO|nr:hypothetical protein [Muriicola jejuensis]NER11789.1 hypothetical protein [Muriicola jejuensis]SMP27375.1 hypothetical protein SAMN06265375_1134 [Muriicola jejuensis]